MDNTFDKMFYDRGDLIAGVDESGVIDIAGPLVAACVIFPKFDQYPEDLSLFNIDDSKKIPEKYRKEHAEVVWNSALAVGIGEVLPSEIDCLGLKNSTSLAMFRAISACSYLETRKQVTPDFLIIDGHKPVKAKISQITVIDGDKKSLSVAAASLVAKVYRDDLMLEYHRRHPHYGWNRNKGFPNEQHFKGLDTHGITLGVHRVGRWPFVGRSKEDDKLRDGEIKWSKRRIKWKKVTEKRLSLEQESELWTSSPRSLNHSMSSKSRSRETVKPGEHTKSKKNSSSLEQ